jgi:hypothetical protein
MFNQDVSCSTNMVTVGDPSMVDASWTSTGYNACTAPNLRLYCFGTDFNVHVP